MTASHTAPVLIMKHSRTCGISAQAFDEVSRWLQEQSETPVHLVTVQSDREISQTIARRFGVRHESPQMLLLRNGQVVWHASHFRVTSAALDAALAAHGAEPATSDRLS